VTTKKLPVRPEPRATLVRPLATASTPRPAYAAALAHAAARKLVTACVAVLPLGALAGSVSACGAAQPTRPGVGWYGEPRTPEPAAPAASTSSSAPPPLAPIAPPAPR
jgi:hypothetical protein